MALKINGIKVADIGQPGPVGPGFENYPLLHQNGRIIWLQRDLHNLATEGRPLSRKGRLEEMYEIRMPLYKQFADYSVINDGSVDQTVAQILSMEGYE